MEAVQKEPLKEQIEQEVAEALATLEPARPPPIVFIITITKGGRLTRLHCAGGCDRMPSEHEWLDAGVSPPAPHLYALRCLHCFPEDARRSTASAPAVPRSGETSASSFANWELPAVDAADAAE